MTDAPESTRASGQEPADDSTEHDYDATLPKASAEVMVPLVAADVSTSPLRPQDGGPGHVRVTVRGDDPGRLALTLSVSPDAARELADRLEAVADEAEVPADD